MTTKTIKRTESVYLDSFLKLFKQGNTLLLTKGYLRSLPSLYSQEHVTDPKAPVKFFGGAFTWYATEAEVVYRNDDDREPIEDIRFFGKVVVNGESELGYFSLKEIGTVRQRGRIVGLGSFSFKNERDQWWTSTQLSKCN